ncbi:MAG: hypothetical protein LBV69_03275 [Bacteroidales bacterium]|jgi:hypothetical protein|nr:hypothetical protein [Bacteroidales bacterium]
MKKIALTIVLFIIFLPVFSQNTGYMGKKFIFNAETSLSPAFFRENFNNERGFGKFHYIIEPNIEYIFHRKMSLGLVYLNTKGKYPIWLHLRNDDIFQIQGVYSINNNSFNSNGIGLFYKYYFTKKSYAPLGYYLKFEFDYFINNYKIDSIDISSIWHENVPIPSSFQKIIPATNGKGSLFAAKFEIGRDFLFFNCLRISTGLSLGITFGGFKSNYAKIKAANPYWKNPPPYYFSWNNNEELATPNENINSILLNMYWVGFKVGIGFVAF